MDFNQNVTLYTDEELEEAWERREKAIQEATKEKLEQETRPFVCTECGKSYATRWNLNRHLSQVHNLSGES